MKNRNHRPTFMLFFLAAAVAVQSHAQWSATTTTGPIYHEGAVGVGTTMDPTARLQIRQSVDTVGGGLRVVRNIMPNYADFYIGGDNQAYIQVDGGSGYLTLQSGGNVGIGTTLPAAKLELKQSVDTVGGGLRVVRNSTTNYADFYIGGDNQAYIQVAGGSGYLTLQTGGNVGIDTTLPRGQLSINNQVDHTATLLTYAATSGGNNGQNILNGYYSNVDGLYSRYFDIAATGSPDGTYGGSVIRFLTNPATSNSAVERMRIDRSGAVGIGKQPDPGYALDVAGTIRGTNVIATFQDVAEWVPVLEQMIPGTVVVVSDSTQNTVAASNSAYDTRVAGVVSPAPGLLLGVESAAKAKIATTGRVKVRADASKGAIHLGDLLVTSDIPGTAMKSEPVDLGGVKFHRPGTLIGKALEPLAKGQGEILVLLSLQ